MRKEQRKGEECKRSKDNKLHVCPHSYRWVAFERVSCGGILRIVFLEYSTLICNEKLLFEAKLHGHRQNKYKVDLKKNVRNCSVLLRCSVLAFSIIFPSMCSFGPCSFLFSSLQIYIYIYIYIRIYIYIYLFTLHVSA
jgi:hypothetical protein